MSTSRILTIATGGTIFQKACGGKMDIAVSVEDVLKEVQFDGQIDSYDVKARSGAELTFEKILKIRDQINKRSMDYDGIVILTGTDSMEELSFALDIMLDVSTTVIVTGAMKPADMPGYDGISNYSEALLVASNIASSGKGVLLAMNNTIHQARYVRKSDSALIGAFTSHPGPIGEVRCGKVIYYYESLKTINRNVEINDERLCQVKVPIWTMTASPYFPEEMLGNIDGLIIAGMGTGSISEQLVDVLSPWTDKVSIVLSSRCLNGLSYDDHAYKGSKEKYEDRGFIIGGYEMLSPLQARTQLCINLSQQ